MGNISESTVSETLFANYAFARNYGCERLIPDGSRKTPDYLLKVGSQIVACEVSEIRANSADLKHYQNLREHGMASILETVGRRLQNKIVQKKAQLRHLRSERIPGIVVFASEGPLATNYLSDDDFLAAMYGLPKGSSAISSELIGHAGDRLLSASQGEYISALCRLESIGSKYRMSVFHNFYAANPLKVENLIHPDDCHFFKKSDPAVGRWGWNV